MRSVRHAGPSLILFATLAAAGIAQADTIITFDSFSTGLFSSGVENGFTVELREWLCMARHLWIPHFIRWIRRTGHGVYIYLYRRRHVQLREPRSR